MKKLILLGIIILLLLVIDNNYYHSLLPVTIKRNRMKFFHEIHMRVRVIKPFKSFEFKY